MTFLHRTFSSRVIADTIFTVVLYKSFCDSVPINASLVSDIIAKKDEVEWYEDDERYEPESET